MNEQALSLEKYANMAACRACKGPCGGKPLPVRVQLQYAENPFGWRVEGFEERLWLAAICKHCGYANSFWLLGIAGSIRPTAAVTQAPKVQRRSIAKRLGSIFREIANGGPSLNGGRRHAYENA